MNHVGNGWSITKVAIRGTLAACFAFVLLSAHIASAGVWTSNGPIGGNGTAVAVEVWSIPAPAVAHILENEPEGLTIGRVRLDDGSVVLGVIGEPAICEGQKEITAFGGWRAYIATLKTE